MESKKLSRFFYHLFQDWGLAEQISVILNLVINLLVLLILAYIINAVLRKFFTSFLERIANKTKTQFDDFLYKNRTVSHFTHLMTLFLIRWFTGDVLVDFPHLRDDAKTAVDILMIVLLIWFIRSVLLTFKDFLRTLNSFKDKPIESYIQVFMIFTWLIGFIVVFSILTGKSLIDMLTALGAVSAIILLIFKDSILGFVASIQVSVNDTVRIGDWITMEKYGADGDVIEINLSSVKVRNFDNTITTIPTYYLISDSFKNWRGMSVSGGRRIKRSVIIKTSSIRFVKEDEVEELKQVQLIKSYLEDRQADIKKYNESHEADKRLLLNGRNMTNFGIFRKYIDEYVNQHPAINKEMMVMVRQLEATPHGIPLEVYAFSRDKVWKNYEYIMGDIFDHLLAAIPFFKLSIYEYPSGTDFNKLEDFNSSTPNEESDQK